MIFDKRRFNHDQQKAQEMKTALHDALMDADPDTLLSIYGEINSWDGTFTMLGIERYTIDDIEDQGELMDFINGLKHHRSDDNPLQYEYFTRDKYNEWVVWDEEKPFEYMDDLVDYLIDEADCPGYPAWSMKRLTLEFNGHEIDDIERFCKIIQEHI